MPKERGRGSAELVDCLEDSLHAKKGYDLMQGRYSSFCIKHLCPENRILIFAPFYTTRITAKKYSRGKALGETGSRETPALQLSIAMIRPSCLVYMSE